MAAITNEKKVFTSAPNPSAPTESKWGKWTAVGISTAVIGAAGTVLAFGSTAGGILAGPAIAAGGVAVTTLFVLGYILKQFQKPTLTLPPPVETKKTLNPPKKAPAPEPAPNPDPVVPPSTNRNIFTYIKEHPGQTLAVAALVGLAGFGLYSLLGRVAAAFATNCAEATCTGASCASTTTSATAAAATTTAAATASNLSASLQNSTQSSADLPTAPAILPEVGQITMPNSSQVVIPSTNSTASNPVANYWFSWLPSWSNEKTDLSIAPAITKIAVPDSLQLLKDQDIVQITRPNSSQIVASYQEPVQVAQFNHSLPITPANVSKSLVALQQENPTAQDATSLQLDFPFKAVTDRVKETWEGIKSYLWCSFKGPSTKDILEFLPARQVNDVGAISGVIASVKEMAPTDWSKCCLAMLEERLKEAKNKQFLPTPLV